MSEQYRGAAEILQRIGGYDEIKKLSVPNVFYSTIKVGVWLSGITGATLCIVTVNDLKIVILCEVVLGILFAHGLELQHEALHGNLFKSLKFNKIIGVIFGVPMLVSFTQYKIMHLHHHKYLGTTSDKEFADYDEKSFFTVGSLLVRFFNITRIPNFIITYVSYLEGRFPQYFRGGRRNSILREYHFLALLLLLGIISLLLMETKILLFAWFIPWLLIAEPMHFLFEVAEHIECHRDTTNVMLNSRSYRTSWLLSYIMNWNNYHIEHHAFPKVALHRLGKIHQYVCEMSPNTQSSYWKAITTALKSRAFTALSAVRI